MLNLINYFRRKRDYKKSYSQSGEDLIIDFIFYCLKIKKPSYLDIGAHHPTHLSNTHFFYLKGSRGVNIEPDPYLARLIRSKRTKDTCLNIGVGFENRVIESDFYVLSAKTLNTFSKEEAERYESYGTFKIDKVIKVPLVPINDVLKNNFKRAPDLISLDVEGLDLEILKSFNFSIYRPKVFCIETITYTEDKTERKISEIIEFMVSNQYFIYADTYINTIFVDKEAWKNR